VGVDRQQMTEMYAKMLCIRLFEEAARQLYMQFLMPGLAHLYIGQEAVAVGACMALRSDDYITSTHRGHGHIIAKGGRTDRMMAELLGKRAGYNRGKGGSMHIADLSLGILGANGIVGGSFGIAAGAALSSKLQKTGRVTICFFGEGATNEGLFFESLNLAAIWKLPVVYLCENNQYGEYTPYRGTTGGESIGLRARAFGIQEFTVDGQDVLAVYGVARAAVEQVRSGSGPSFIEAKTYRYHGHHVGDPGTGYRTKEEVSAWRARDPITLFRNRLLEDGICDESTIQALEDDVHQEIQGAVAFAKDAPFPATTEVKDHVYA
jgi:TPP-dependent pyruvate/acetoin dehydrogenase alpha subunit